MAFPTAPANDQFHREDGVLYYAADGRWKRAGDKGLDFRHASVYMLNQTGALKARLPRLPHKKIMMHAVWEPQTVSNTRIQIWGVNDQPISFTGKVDDYHLFACWGDGGLSKNNSAITSQPPTNNGILVHDGGATHRSIDGEPHYIEAEFTEHVANYINIRWTALITNQHNTAIHTIGEAVVHTDLKQIQSVGLTWDANPRLTKAAAHTQWF